MRFTSIRAVLLGCVAVGIMSLGTAVASASAAECPGTVEGGGVALCSEGHEQHGTFAFTGQNKSGYEIEPLNVLNGGEPTKIGCSGVKLTKGNFVGSTGKLEVSGLYLEYTGCKLTSENKSKCELKSETILVDGGEGKGVGPGLSSNIVGTAEAAFIGGGLEKEWTKYTIKSTEGATCITSHTVRVVGTAKCKLPESTVEAVTHLLKCEESGSELRWAGLNVGFVLTAEVKLTSGKKWSLQKI